MRAVGFVLLVVVACGKSKSKKPDETEPLGTGTDRVAFAAKQKLPAELAFTCEKILPKAIREVVFPDGKNLRGAAQGKVAFYACELETDADPLVIELDCSTASLGCDKPAEDVGRFACVEGTTLRFVPSKLDCVAKLVHADAETALELAKALDEVYTNATVSR